MRKQNAKKILRILIEKAMSYKKQAPQNQNEKCKMQEDGGVFASSSHRHGSLVKTAAADKEGPRPLRRLLLRLQQLLPQLPRLLPQ